MIFLIEWRHRLSFVHGSAGDSGRPAAGSVRQRLSSGGHGPAPGPGTGGSDAPIAAALALLF